MLVCLSKKYYRGYISLLESYMKLHKSLQICHGLFSISLFYSDHRVSKYLIF